jgi:hypothetical protein
MLEAPNAKIAWEGKLAPTLATELWLGIEMEGECE